MTQPDGKVTILCAVMNRVEPLRYTLPTWTHDEQVEQVLIVDWGSQIPVAQSLDEMDYPNSPRITDQRSKVRILRVNNVTNWVLSWAVNFGLSHVYTPYVIKLDADILLTQLSIAGMLPQDKEFMTGQWKNARNWNEHHLNGQLSARIADLRAVGCYDERITRYGFDDGDLYFRLQDQKLRRVYFPTDSMFHLPHTDKARVANTRDAATSPRESDKIVRRVAASRNKWDAKQPCKMFLRVTEERSNYTIFSLKH